MLRLTFSYWYWYHYSPYHHKAGKIYSMTYMKHCSGCITLKQLSGLCGSQLIGAEGNDISDILAKQALKLDIIMEVSFSKAEAKALIRSYIMNAWQKHWNEGNKGRHLYKIKQKVGGMKAIGKNNREQAVISRLRLGHTGLNKTMHLLRKHQQIHQEFVNMV